ncbi:helix-turn-helix domain-containing protein [Enterococcus asini]|uniref:helix-turn-helix domain-containing protein n=1 Tax=Enterococcus asini TaxID=57732 RepID=UPI00266DB19A|nr:Rgg/GadR/MutR family transcriptional regulator [Enterococcus asini]
MDNFGETLRKIRLEKGLTQKSLYHDLLSKSYAIRFEQGKHDISFVLLLEILERLPMEISEFLFIHRNYQPSETQWFYAQLIKSGNNMDLAALATLKKEYQTRYGDSQQQSGRLVQLDYRLEQLRYYDQSGQITEESVTPELQGKIQNLLAATQSWTMEDLRFFAATLDLVPTSDLTLFFQGLIPSIKRYREFAAGKNVLCILLINAIHKALFSKAYGIAQELLALLDDFADGLDYLAYRNFADFYAGLLQLVGGKSGQLEYDQGIASAQQASMVFRQLKYPFYTQMTQDILQAFLDFQGA